MKISIEGIPGSGKTSLLNLLGAIGYKVFPSTKDETWESLQKLRPERYTLGMNLSTLLKLTNPIEDELRIYENSPYSLHWVCTQLQIADKLLQPAEVELQYRILDTWSWKPDCIIFLDCSPQICGERLGKGHQLDYLQKISLEYDWAFDYSNCTIPVYRINANDNLDHILYHTLQILFQIRRHEGLGH